MSLVSVFIHSGRDEKYCLPLKIGADLTDAYLETESVYDGPGKYLRSWNNY